jgi:hypothetical protein
MQGARVVGRLILLVCSWSLFSSGSTSAEEEAAGEWIDFSVGKELTGVATEGNWALRDGVISLDPRPGEEGWKRYASYLWLEGDFRDFECEFDFKFEAGGNSGVYFRVADAADPVRTGIEVQLTDCHGKDPLGWHDLGGLIRFSEPEKGKPLANASRPAGEWNSARITLQDNRLSVLINGITVQDLDLNEHPLAGAGLAASGSIGFQDHGLPFQLRKLRIRRL